MQVATQRPAEQEGTDPSAAEHALSHEPQCNQLFEKFTHPAAHSVSPTRHGLGPVSPDVSDIGSTEASNATSSATTSNTAASSAMTSNGTSLAEMSDGASPAARTPIRSSLDATSAPVSPRLDDAHPAHRASPNSHTAPENQWRPDVCFAGILAQRIVGSRAVIDPMRVHPSITSALFVVATTTMSRCAHGQDRAGASIHYVIIGSASRCPDEAEFLDQLRARLGFDPRQRGPAISVDVVLRVDRRSMRAEILQRADDGTIAGVRRIAIPDSDCASLARSAATALAVILDPLPPGAFPRANPPSESSTAPPPQPAATSTPPRAVEGETHIRALPDPLGSRVVWWLRQGIRASVLSAPAPAFGATLGVRARRRWFSGGIDLLGDLPGEGGTASSRGSVRVRLAFVTAALAACAHVAWWQLCGEGIAGSSVASGSLDGNEAPSELAPFAAGGLRTATRWEISGRVALYLQVDLIVPITRTVIAFGPSEATWSAPPVFVTFGAGVEERVP